MSEYIDNVSRRKQILKDVLAGLHAGKSLEDVREAFTELVQIATYDDISEAEQMLIAEGLPAAEIQKLCDLHVSVVRDSLDAQPTPESLAGHPVHTLRAENRMAKTMLEQIGDALAGEPSEKIFDVIVDRLTKLMLFERHYLRKENLLFPFLEKKGFTGPSQVMWGIHDEIRADWAKLRELFASDNDFTSKWTILRTIFEPMRHKMDEMFYKEEKILIPTSLERLTEEDWSAIYAGEPELGTFYTTRGAAWQPVPARQNPAPQQIAAPVTAPAMVNPVVGVMISLATGLLSPEQINLMLTNLPIDITFVDENDEVRYFTQGKERIFERQATIIGRKVQLCHPPQSVDKVQKILDDFKAGTRDVAEFWIQMMGKFIHIRYYALRDAAGTYRGTIEVSQDVTGIRALEGERRLLND